MSDLMSENTITEGIGASSDRNSCWSQSSSVVRHVKARYSVSAEERATEVVSWFSMILGSCQETHKIQWLTFE